jgi:hypothetical protein
MRREPERDINLLLSEVVVIIDALARANETALALRFARLREQMQADANAERARWDWSPGWNIGPEQGS